MKTNIAGWIYTILSPLYLMNAISMVIFPIIVGYDKADIPVIIISVIISSMLAVYSFIWGSSVRRHKKWTWKAGIEVISILIAVNIFSFLNTLELLLLIPLAVNIFCVYALVSEKELFETS